MKIKGSIVKVALGMGFWGIVDDAGNEWRPISMPEQLKKEGKKVQVYAERVEDAPSIFMWGTPIKITQFET